MAIISSTTTTLIPPLTISAPHSLPSKWTTTTAKLCSFTFLPSSHPLTNSFKTLKPSVSPSRIFAAPEDFDSEEEVVEEEKVDTEEEGEEEEEEDPVVGLEDDNEDVEETYSVPVPGASGDGSSEPAVNQSFAVDADQIVPKQKIRIKLRSYWVKLIEDSSKLIMDAARTTNAKTMGPVPLPTKIRKYCVLKSPHVHKDARFQFEIRTHQRLIDILFPTAQTIDSLMHLNIPAGVDVEVKL